METSICGMFAIGAVVLLLAIGKILKSTRPMRKRMQAKIISERIAERKYKDRMIREWITIEDYDILSSGRRSQQVRQVAPSGRYAANLPYVLMV